MFKLRTTLALFLALAYALPALCIALPGVEPATQRAPAAPCGGCHRHHHQMPAPQRYCCANHEAPAALQASASPISLNSAGYQQADEPAGNPGSIMISVNHGVFFSPPPAVLRI